MVDPNAPQQLNGALRRLEAARLLLEGGFPADALQRAYSVVLYAARTLLAQRGLTPTTQAAVRRQLSRQPDLRAHLDTKLATVLQHEYVDAEYHARIPPAEHVAARLDEAERFVEAARALS